jgi:hypothetical protein
MTAESKTLGDQVDELARLVENSLDSLRQVLCSPRTQDTHRQRTHASLIAADADSGPFKEVYAAHGQLSAAVGQIPVSQMGGRRPLERHLFTHRRRTRARLAPRPGRRHRRPPRLGLITQPPWSPF